MANGATTLSREARFLELALRSARLLATAVNSGDPGAIERACSIAETVGVSDAARFYNDRYGIWI